MIFVDSSVWIDYFNDKSTFETDFLDAKLGNESVGVGDVVLTEVLQGFKLQRDFKRAQTMMLSLHNIDTVGQDIAIKAAINFRYLRARGITVRKTIDTLIATCCIENGHTLLYSDRDFDPFVKLLGMKTAAPIIG